MTTELQIRANQQNAQKSTGPKTEEGKRKVSMNRITHGLRARPVVIQDEDAEAFEDMRNTLLKTLDAKGDIETFYADRAAVAMWRLNRVLALEGRLLLHRLALEEEETPEQAFAREVDLMSKGLAGLSAYESRLEAKFNAAVAALRHEQKVSVFAEMERQRALARGNPLQAPTAPR